MNKGIVSIVGLTFGMAFAAPAQAGICIGNCGSLGADGDVTTSPSGNTTYQYVTTFEGSATTAGEIAGVGDGAGGYNTGSQFTSDAFVAGAGDNLTFYFNYVTSDGSGYADYAWAELVSGGSHVAWLFTGRTQESGDTSPGFGLPANDATLTPATTAIVPGAPVWSPLGDSSDTCFDTGCGYTGWIQSSYGIGGAGVYQVVYGVTNWSDSAFQSGLAFDGLALNDVPIGGAIPEPSTWAMLILGFGAAGAAMRRRQRTARVRFA